MVRPWFGCEVEVCGDEGSPELGDKFLHSVAFVAEALTAEVAVEAGGVPGPMGEFVEDRTVVALCVRARLRAAEGEGEDAPSPAGAQHRHAGMLLQESALP